MQYDERDAERTIILGSSDGGLTWEPIESFAGGGGGSGTEYVEGAIDATITGTAIMWEDAANTLRPVAEATPLPVNVVAGGTSGVQYDEGDTDAAITGTAILWEDAADTLRAVSASNPLPVDVSGVATEATLAAVETAVDGVEALLTTIDADTSTLAAVDYATGADITALISAVNAVETAANTALTDTELRATAVPVSLASVPSHAVTDGGSSLTVDGPLTDAELRATAVDVNITGGSSSGTEYTEGGTDATITGTAIMWEDTSDTLRPVAAATPLPVNVVSGSASGTEFTEGAAAAGGADGPAILAVRRDSATPGTGVADGDYALLSVNSNGALRVTNAGASSEVTEDAAAVADPIGPHMIARRRDTLSASEVSADGDVIAVNANAEGAVWVELANPEAVGGGTQYTEDDAAPANPVGTQMMARRVDSLVSVAADGDHVALNATQYGELRTYDEVTAAGVTQLGGPLSTVDFAASSSLQMAGGRASTATPSAVSADNDAQSFWLTRNGALNVADGGGSLTVDGTVAVTGVATETTLAAVETAVDGIEALLTTIDADTGGILTAVETLDNAISGSEMQVDVVAALPAGTNLLGKVGLDTVSSATLTSPAMSTTVATLAASNASRKGLIIFNDTGQTLYVKFGATATTTDFTLKIPDQAVYELPMTGLYTGQVTGILSTGSGEAYVTEL